jgi:hypothetical protein
MKWCMSGKKDEEQFLIWAEWQRLNSLLIVWYLI